MSWLLALVVFPLLAYLAGSVPFGYLAGRLKGVDIRQLGSHNVGATNVGRVLGRRLGLTVFGLDVLKGAIPVTAVGLWLHFASPWSEPSPTMFGLWMLSAFAAIAGHVWPIWLRFRGGKGVATSLGVLLALYPFFTWPGLVALATWVVVTLVSRYVSLGSIVAAIVFVGTLFAKSLLSVSGGTWAPQRIWPLLAFGLLMSFLIIWRHRGNIGRLLAGTENKIGSSRAK